MADQSLIDKIMQYLSGKKDDSKNDNRYGNQGKGSKAYDEAKKALDDENKVTVADSGE